MSARQLTSRLILEVQKAVSSFAPRREDTDREQLSALARDVLGSVDVRDLKRVTPETLVGELEDLLSLMRERKRGEIKVSAHRAGDVLVIETCLDDQPFLVSTLRAALANEQYEIKSFFNAIVRVRRNPAGRSLAIGSGNAESLMRVEVSTRTSEDEGVPEGVIERIEKRLKLAQAMVLDFSSMVKRIDEVADSYFAAASMERGEVATGLREAEELLRWLCDESFVLLAVEEYDASGALQTAWGTSRIHQPERDDALVAAAAKGEGRQVRYQRSGVESPVHRAGKLGHFLVTVFSDDGKPSGCLIIDGLFTYKALHTPPEQIPVIRRTLEDLLTDGKVSTHSNRGKNITNAFNSLPLEYLLIQDRESIWELTDQILRAEAEGGSDVHIRIGEQARFAFVVVALPRWQFSEELRQEVQSILLEDLMGTYADYGVYIDRYDNAVIHYYVTGVGPLREVDTEQLRTKVLAHARSWSDRLGEAAAAVDEGRKDELVEIYTDAFNDEHKRRCSVRRIEGDIRCLERLRTHELDIDCDLYASEFGDNPGSLNLRIFSREALNLSRELPVITNFGFEVVDEYSRDISIAHLPTIDMDNFRFDVRPDRIGQIMGRRNGIVSALRDVFAGRVGDDDLNRLIVVSELGARDVEILRAIVAYLHQLQVPFGSDVIRQVLVDHAPLAQALVGWLSARFDPGQQSSDLRESSEAALAAELRQVTDYTADRVLAAVAEVVRAVRRTNAYVAEEGKALAFKIATETLSFGRDPKPFREIWVYHPDFEGVHLRGGRVARGGLRFSDRPDDFRTEIHGLMATQMVKNVLIVPMGAKGGFVLRNPPAERDALRAAGDAFYKRFIGALLSITDNVVDGVAKHPEGIIPFDEGEDPYLVVAADKGTAHLSDTANAISADQGFWLDDAFASGGSNGYDHKKTGITARGAWEVSKRSFRELGIDPEADEITAIGVGDMSGDVFGNGLLRSKTIKLIAAFNHMHVFVDPDPDPAKSFEERKRLFEMPRSSWEDYSKDVISEGGGVYSRKAKELDLSPKVRALLGFGPDEPVSGDKAISAVMKLDVDLLWMGGIGTYVKAKDESNAEVGDKANDSVRVNANELGCRVLGEGANLAITDRGRVEFAKRGGENYNAFLDNSGGVDVSDHEVNIKILFAPLLLAGSVSRDARNALLEDCEDEVVQMVLENNRSQSRMVSFDVRRSCQDVFRYYRALEFLAAKVPFNPDMFAMPGEEELHSRARRGHGLYKHEAAVLCAHAKMLAYRELLEDEPLPEGLVRRMVVEYFPKRVLELAGEDAVNNHLLHREIGTTMLVNHIVENAGGSMLAEVALATGSSTRDISLAYMHASAACEWETLCAELYASETSKTQPAIYRSMKLAQTWLEDATYYLLDQMPLPPMDDEAARKTASLLSHVDDALPAGSSRRTAARTARLVEAGVPSSLAGRLVRLRYLTPVLDAVRLAMLLGRTPEEWLQLRLKVTDVMGFLYLNQAIDHMEISSHWDGPAVNALRRQLNFHLHKLMRLVEGDDVAGMVEKYNLGDFNDRIREEVDTGVTISGLVMLDDWLRRVLPPLTTIAKA
ncbi:MAG: NAD-glutamate dehydrogenase domain-containing protein [Nannocystaceae bacterium]|nr:NAD-glutamate dehydrogenase [bacterium]